MSLSNSVLIYCNFSSRCKHVVKRACYDNSTSNLWDHVNAKHPELPANQGTVTVIDHVEIEPNECECVCGGPAIECYVLSVWSSL